MIALDSFMRQMSDMGKEKYYSNLCFMELLGGSTAPGRDSCISPSVKNGITEAEKRMCSHPLLAGGNREVNVFRELQKRGAWLIIVRINI